MAKQKKREQKKTTIKVSLEQRPDFKGNVAAFVFDVAGNLLERAVVKAGRVTLPLSEDELGRNRFFLVPVAENFDDMKSTVKMMERLGAYEPVLRVGGQLIDVIKVPGVIIDVWPICFCWVRGRVVKSDSGRPVCGARVHICEVDKVWRWILELPELEVFRLRDDLLKIFEKPPLRFPPKPEPDPPPFTAARKGLIGLGDVAFNPQPEPPRLRPVRQGFTEAGEVGFNPQPEPPGDLLMRAASVKLPSDAQAALVSSSAHIVRQALIDNVRLIIPYLCLWPRWWTFRCDEIAVVETDAFGRFQAIIPYLCDGDKPDLYFWVEYEIGGILETVYRPPIACHTDWNYECGKEVTIRISDDRVPACDDEPDLAGCVVQILSIGRKVSMSEIHGSGAAVADEGLTTDDRPFGGKLEPRIWLSRTALRDAKNIHFYRWSYRRLTQGDGTPLSTPGPWTELTRTVVRHFAKPGPSGVTHVPYPLGPQPVGAQTNLFEIKPAPVPAGGIEWTVVDEREDLASAHFETAKLGSGTSACEKAEDAAGKYELKLELFKNSGVLVDWTAEGIDLQTTDVPAPFGTGTVTASTAPEYNRIKNSSGHTVAFRMVLRVDNNCCEAKVEPVTGTGVTITPCGFIEFASGASVKLHFKAGHPNNFANFNFSVKRGVSAPVARASAAGRVGSASVPTNDVTPPARAYTLTAPSDYQEDFPVEELLGDCERAAFSEALHVVARATNGYGLLWHLNAFDHEGFALTPLP